MNQVSRTAARGIGLGFIALLQLIVGLLIQLSVLRAIGAGSDTDAFVAAQALPLVLFAILSVSMQSVWQPRLALESKVVENWLHAQSEALGQAFILVGGIILFAGITSGLWIPLLYPGLDISQASLVSHMTLPLLLAAALNCQSAILTVALRAVDQFATAEVVNLIASAVALAAIILLVPHEGVRAAAWILCARAVVVFGTLYLYAGRPRVDPRLGLASHAIWQQLRPLLVGSSFYKTAPLVDRYWGSQAEAGGLTTFSLAQTGMGAAATVLERSICMPLIPQLARLVDSKDMVSLRRTYRNCVFRVHLATGCALLGLLVLLPVWNQLLAILLKLEPTLANQLWWLCIFLLGYMHVAASGGVVVAAFYAFGNTRTPVKVGIIGFVIGIILKSIGFIFLGLPGLALATSIYYIGNMSAMCYLLEGEINARVS